MEQIITGYIERANYANGQAAKYKKLSDIYSLYRLLSFGGFILCVALAITVNQLFIIVVALIALIFCFGWLVKTQGGYDDKMHYWLDIGTVNQNEVNSITSGGNIYNDGDQFVSDKHYYTSDLDIFGANSLYQLVNRAATAQGMIRLGEWLSTAADRETIVNRQHALKELAIKSDWKIEFQAYLVFCLKQNRGQVKNLLNYLKVRIKVTNERALRVYIPIAPWLLAAVGISAIFFAPAWYLVVFLVLANNRIVSSKSRAIAQADLIAGKIAEMLSHFASAFGIIETESWRSAAILNLHTLIKKGEGGSVSSKIRQLSKLITKLDYRLNLVTGAIMESIFLWSIKQLIAIEDWKKANNDDFEIAFDALAEFEALVSLSSLAINYPEWSFPGIATGEGYTLTAKSMAHPLINNTSRIANDFSLEDKFHVDIITGSNMAGKSTFLRTLGINTVLAFCGAPVCAAKMKVSVMQVITYMRIKDSLNESTSTFKAELDRLQLLLKAVDSNEKIYFLIDEMLRGTNSVDKYLGSKAVIEKLVAKKAVGVVATHDLQIAKLEEEHPGYIRNFYFDIQIANGEMMFDYKIKPGECKTFNASLLLKQIGIDAV